MTTVLSISSQVIYGPVGNSAAVPALEHCGVEVLPVPTVVLSNHPGHETPVIQDIPDEIFEAMLQALEGNGWLEDCAGVLSGCFRRARQAEIVADLIGRMQSGAGCPVYLCDPVIGDEHTGPYVPQAVAVAIKDRLVPLADIVTPNRFELEWLTGMPVGDLQDAIRSAAVLQTKWVLAKSIPAARDRIISALISDETAFEVTSVYRDQVPHGAGDLMAGLFLGHYVTGAPPKDCLSRTVSQLQDVFDASAPGPVLRVVDGLRGQRKSHGA